MKSWLVTFKANGVATSETVEAPDEDFAKDEAVQLYPGATITELAAKEIGGGGMSRNMKIGIGVAAGVGLLLFLRRR